MYGKSVLICVLLLVTVNSLDLLVTVNSLHAKIRAEKAKQRYYIYMCENVIKNLLGSHNEHEAPALRYQLSHLSRAHEQRFVHACMLHFLHFSVRATASAHVWNTHGTIRNV